MSQEASLTLLKLEKEREIKMEGAVLQKNRHKGITYAIHVSRVPFEPKRTNNDIGSTKDHELAPLFQRIAIR
jgi:hypothetical protein